MNWHPFAEKFPLLEGEEWSRFKESIARTHGNEEPILYRVVNGKQEGIDGRNRYRACEELGLPPQLKQIAVDDDEVRDFILRRNVHRRHLTRELRQELVGDLRAEGKSTRQIAQTLGVSQTTVVTDLKAGERNRSPEAVTGRDGKTYPATAPPVQPLHPTFAQWCARCQRHKGPSCPACRKLVAEYDSRPQPAREPGDDTEQLAADKAEARERRKQAAANGQPVLDWTKFNHGFRAIAESMEHFGKAHGANLTGEAEALRRTLYEWRKDFRRWYEQVSGQKAPADMHERF
jgi:hypothetical protein